MVVGDPNFVVQFLQVLSCRIKRLIAVQKDLLDYDGSEVYSGTIEISQSKFTESLTDFDVFCLILTFRTIWNLECCQLYISCFAR